MLSDLITKLPSDELLVWRHQFIKLNEVIGQL